MKPSLYLVEPEDSDDESEDHSQESILYYTITPPMVNGERAILLECYYGYKQFFESHGIEPLSIHGDSRRSRKKDRLRHAAGYLPAFYQRITVQRLGDAKALLFLVQGILWDQGYFSLNELRDHNRSI